MDSDSGTHVRLEMKRWTYHLGPGYLECSITRSRLSEKKTEMDVFNKDPFIKVGNNYFGVKVHLISFLLSGLKIPLQN